MARPPARCPGQSHQCQRHRDIESKDLEFDLANNGIIALQTAFNCMVTGVSKITLDKIAEVLAENPRQILGLENETIKENAKANLTLFTLNDKKFTQTDFAWLLCQISSCH